MRFVESVIGGVAIVEQAYSIGSSRAEGYMQVCAVESKIVAYRVVYPHLKPWHLGTQPGYRVETEIERGSVAEFQVQCSRIGRYDEILLNGQHIPQHADVLGRLDFRTDIGVQCCGSIGAYAEKSANAQQIEEILFHGRGARLNKFWYG